MKKTILGRIAAGLLILSASLVAWFSTGSGKTCLSGEAGLCESLVQAGLNARSGLHSLAFNLLEGPLYGGDQSKVRAAKYILERRPYSTTHAGKLLRSVCDSESYQLSELAAAHGNFDAKFMHITRLIDAGHKARAVAWAKVLSDDAEKLTVGQAVYRKSAQSVRVAASQATEGRGGCGNGDARFSGR